MEDMGWYRVNYSLVDELDWGKKFGCFFIKVSCKMWMEEYLWKKKIVVFFCYVIKKILFYMCCMYSKLLVVLCNFCKYYRVLFEEY